MRIVIREPDGRNINIRLPHRIIFNRITAFLASTFFKNRGMQFTRRQAFCFIKSINTVRRANPGLKLLEMKSADGQYIEIQL